MVCSDQTQSELCGGGVMHEIIMSAYLRMLFLCLLCLVNLAQMLVLMQK